MKISTTRLQAAAILTAAVLLSAACGSTNSDKPALVGETSPELSALYDQAVSAGETSVVFYGPQAKDLKPAFELFEQRFPKITVDAVGLFGPQLDSRIRTEAATGQRAADLVQVANTPIPFARDNLCAPYRPDTADKVPAQYSDLDDKVVAATLVPFGLMYNKSKVSSPPEGWNDLISGDYKDMMTIANPTVGGIADAMSAGLQSGTFTPEYLRKLQEQGLVVASDGQAVGQAVASGQSGIGLFVPYVVFQQLQQKGIDVGFVFPVEGGNYVSPFLNCLVAEAPHPTAGKLLESWFFSPEAQQALAELGQYGTAPGSPSPEGLPPLAEVEQMQLPSLSDTFDASSTNNAVLKSIFDR